MEKVTEIFGQNVFNETVMKERLPKETYKQLMKTIDGGGDAGTGRIQSL